MTRWLASEIMHWRTVFVFRDHQSKLVDGLCLIDEHTFCAAPIVQSLCDYAFVPFAIHLPRCVLFDHPVLALVAQ